jgi:5'-3' exonuclease
MNKYVLVDGNNILHRANAIFMKGKEVPLINNKGYPTGLVYGVFSMLSDWVSSIPNPTSIKFFLDGIPIRRRTIDPNYKMKEGRSRIDIEDCPLDLSDGTIVKNQMHIIIHLLGLLGIDIYYHEEEEADDLIASFVKKYPDDVHIILSSDIDFYQLLVNHNVVIYRPGIKGNRFFDAERAEEDLFKKFKVRVPPASIRMFKTLTGDASDLIVGVPRLRKKVAAPLCAYKSVGELYGSGFPGFSKAEKAKALEDRDRIEKNFQLIGLNGNIDLESIRSVSEPDFARADKILKNDLQISTIPVYTFLLDQKKVRIGDSKPIYDWLGDI